jgi:CRP-like cAMP-binding protein
MKLKPRRSNPKVAELKDLKVFAGLGRKQLEAMAYNLDEAALKKGERIMYEGRYNDTFWIILEGEVDLTIGGRVHETLLRGDIFGLPSMFTGRTAMADGVARTEVRTLVASHAQFNSLVADPEVEIRFKAAMFDRLRDEVYQLTHSAPAKPPKAARNSQTSKKTSPKKPS